jgi:ABC-type sugar transport system ATPase subunit
MQTLALKSVRKRFPGVEALKGISFALEQGRIYGLVGENGAGKSTLVKILMGLYHPDEGEVSIAGSKVQIANPTQARYELGVDAVFQDHASIPKMSIAENVFLDRLHTFYRRGLIDYRTLQERAGEVLARVGLEIDVSAPIEGSSEAEKSLIDLAKALCRDPKILILDEMTAPLASSVVHELFDIMRKLKHSGTTIIFVSHRLEEVLAICDEIIVLKDGNLEGIIDHSDKTDLTATRRQVVRMMTGTEKGLHFPPKSRVEAKGPVVLSLKDASNTSLHSISLDVHQHEIVALAGLDGQGQSTLLRAIAGLLPHVEGSILLDGRPLRVCNPYQAIGRGVFYVSDRRDEEELWLSHDVWLNVSLASVGQRAPFGLIGGKNDRQIVGDMVSNLRVEPPSLTRLVSQLSGGNRQKVVLGKYLLAKPRILLMDQPTIGLDVGAKLEIYRLLRELADEGIPTLTVLTDLEEVVNLPDRILVMHEGIIAREFGGETINEEELLDSYYG